MTDTERTALTAERDEARAALAVAHRHTGRGDGHRTPGETATCIVSAFVSAGMAVGGAEREAKEASNARNEIAAEAERLRALLAEALIFINDCQYDAAFNADIGALQDRINAILGAEPRP